jgi:transposase, IS30 family
MLDARLSNPGPAECHRTTPGFRTDRNIPSSEGTSAHALAYHRASRPKLGKLAQNLELRGKVEADLAKKYSPEQIAGRLTVEFPDQPEMQVSTETINQSLYVQSRGALKRDLTRYLRTGRAVRRPSRKVGQRKNRIPNMINIAERPAEADDRAVPGHWESQCCCQAA